MLGDHIGESWLGIERPIDLYVVASVSVFPVSASKVFHNAAVLVLALNFICKSYVLTYGNSSFFVTLATGERGAIGLYDSPSSPAYKDFRMVMILPVFYISYICIIVSDIGNRYLRNWFTFTPRCFIMMEEISSGPSALELLDVKTAFLTLFVVK